MMSRPTIWTVTPRGKVRQMTNKDVDKLVEQRDRNHVEVVTKLVELDAKIDAVEAKVDAVKDVVSTDWEKDESPC